MQQVVAKLGGLEALRAIPAWTVETTCTFTRSGSSHAVRYEAAGDEFRIEHRLSDSDAPAVLVTSGHGKPARKDPTGIKQIPPHVTHAWTIPPMAARTLQRGLDDPKYTFRDYGPSPDGTEEMVVIVNQTTFLNQMVTPQTWYIDKATLLPVKVVVYEYNATTTRIHALVGFGFSDYRSVGSIMIPYQITHLLGDTVIDTTIVTGVEFNAVSNDDFAPAH